MKKHKFTVAVIDDDSSLKPVFAEAFNSRNIGLVFLESSSELSRFSSQQSLDVALIDIILKDENGIHVGLMLEKDPLFWGSLFFYMSGVCTEPAVIEELVGQTQGKGYFIKPLEIEKVVDTIENSFFENKREIFLGNSQLVSKKIDFNDSFCVDSKRYDSEHYLSFKQKCSAIDLDFFLPAILDSNFSGQVMFSNENIKGSFYVGGQKAFEIQIEGKEKADIRDLFMNFICQDWLDITCVKKTPPIDQNGFITKEEVRDMVFDKWFLLDSSSLKTFYQAFKAKNIVYLDKQKNDIKTIADKNNYTLITFHANFSADLENRNSRKIPKPHAQKNQTNSKTSYPLLERAARQAEFVKNSHFIRAFNILLDTSSIPHPSQVSDIYLKYSKEYDECTDSDLKSKSLKSFIDECKNKFDQLSKDSRFPAECERLIKAEKEQMAQKQEKWIMSLEDENNFSPIHSQIQSLPQFLMSSDIKMIEVFIDLQCAVEVSDEFLKKSKKIILKHKKSLNDKSMYYLASGLYYHLSGESEKSKICFQNTLQVRPGFKIAEQMLDKTENDTEEHTILTKLHKFFG